MQTEDVKTFEILFETEKTADQILLNKNKTIDLNKQKEKIRESIKIVSTIDQLKIWITLSGLILKIDKKMATEILGKDTALIDKQIKQLCDLKKKNLKKHFDLEQNISIKGLDLKPLSNEEISPLRAASLNFNFR